MLLVIWLIMKFKNSYKMFFTWIFFKVNFYINFLENTHSYLVDNKDLNFLQNVLHLKWGYIDK